MIAGMLMMLLAVSFGLLIFEILFLILSIFITFEFTRTQLFNIFCITLTIFVVDFWLLEKTLTSNVRYTDLSVYIKDDSAYVLDKEKEVNLNFHFKRNFKEGDIIYRKDANFGPIYADMLTLDKE